MRKKLFWKSLRALAPDIRLFVHLVSQMNRYAVIAMLVLTASFGGRVVAQSSSMPLHQIPSNAKDIGVEAKIGNPLPIDLEFANEKDETVKLAEIVDGSVPVFITLNYSNCPGLCIAQLGNLAKTINGLDSNEMQLGRDFKLVSISIDPTETAARLADTKDRYAPLLEGNHSADGWYFLRGSMSSIRKIAEATGFKYTFDEKTNQFNHAAVAVGVSPDGIITRYLFDLALEPATLRLALVETSEGKLGSVSDQLILWCYHFDPNENRYTTSARRLMSIGGAVFVIVGLVASIPFWLNRRGSPPEPPKGSDSGVASA